MHSGEPPSNDAPVRSTRWLLYSGIGLSAALLLVSVIASLGLKRALTTSYKSFPEAQKLIFIAPGTRTEAILAQLRSSGVLEYEFPAMLYLWWNRDRGGIKAGEYLFDRTLTAVQVLDKLVEGKVHQRSITFPEGFTLQEIAQLMETKGLAPRTVIMQALMDVAFIKDLDPAAADLEGYLFPDTYFYVRDTPPKELVRRMVGRFREVFTPIWMERARQLGLGIRSAVTLASMIEKETAVDAERPKVSAVFHRRLAKRMLLQCDPTVIYASILAGKYDGVIHRSDLDRKSPYNTYQSSGLPPGPIANPGAKALQAALYPDPVDYLYFVARKDGTHQFSETLGEHNKATRLYQR
jgi:UPF0755 protein